MKTNRFERRVVVVTGGASGIGLATAHAFAEHGAPVMINDIRADAASAAAGSIQAVGGKAAAFACDIADRDAVRKTAEEIVAGGREVVVVIDLSFGLFR